MSELEPAEYIMLPALEGIKFPSRDDSTLIFIGMESELDGGW